MNIASGITQHTIVLCVDKREKGMVLENLLRKKGFKVDTVLSLYDALKVVSQEMPHLVISDSILTDGTAGTLYDRMSQHPMLKNTPIMVLVAKKTREQLTPLTGRKFAGFLLGQFDGGALMAKISEVTNHNKGLSPYFVPFTREGMEVNFTMSVEAFAMGLSGEQVIYRSTSEVDPAAALVCVPFDNGFSPVLLKMGTNIVKGEDVYNLFPLARIRGKGRKWISELPSVDLEDPSHVEDDDENMARVIFFDPLQNRFEQFREVLGGYNIDLIHAPSIQKAIRLIQRDAGSLGCVYFQELTGLNVALLREALEKIDQEHRPPIIVGTSSLNTRSTREIRYIKKPFGLGILVEAMESAIKASSSLGRDLAGAHEAVNLECNYQAPAKLIGLDETGGIIELKFPVVKGNRIRLDHPFLRKIWEGDVLAEITATASLEGKPDIWQVRFEAVSAKGNKVKYWEMVEKSLEEDFPKLDPKTA
tara:strand:+ start:540 stop:1967 length:1428 start_codon:yes stop_codon:yes gene_type:complete